MNSLFYIIAAYCALCRIEAKGKLPFVGKLPIDAKGIPGIG